MPGHTCGGECDHGDHGHTSEESLAIQYNLYEKIDMDNLVCLNESRDGSGKTVFKPWNERLDREKYVESDVDSELLFNVPFTGDVKLRALVIIGGEGASHPKLVRLFKNKPQMSFDDTGGTADQEFELARDSDGRVEYELKVAKFSSVHHLSLYFPTNFGNDDSSTTIYYIGLKGDFIREHTDGVVLATYEARPMAKDHKGELPEMGRHELS